MLSVVKAHAHDRISSFYRSDDLQVDQVMERQASCGRTSLIVLVLVWLSRFSLARALVDLKPATFLPNCGSVEVDDV